MMTPEAFFDPQSYLPLLELTFVVDRPYSPVSWAGAGLAALGKNNLWEGLLGFTPLLALCWLVWSVALRLAERQYFLGLNRIQENRPLRFAWPRAFRLRVPFLARWFRGRMGPAAAAIVLKDFRFFLRDLNYLVILAAPLLMNLLTILTFLLPRPARPASTHAVQIVPTFSLPPAVELMAGFLSFFLPTFLSQFLGLMIGAYLMTPLISLEGRGFALLRSAPVTPRVFIRAKLFTGLLAILPLYAFLTALLQVILYHGRVPLFIALYTHLTQVLILAGLVAVFLNLGAARAQFNWVNPGRLMTVGLWAHLLAGVLFLSGAVVLFYIAPASLLALDMESIPLLLLGPLGGLVYCGLVLRGQMQAAERRTAALFAGD
jgi:hypothetical protein